MSSANRSTTRGGKGSKPDFSVVNKQQKTDTKPDTPKTLEHNPKIQPTAEQMRIAQIIDTRTEDPNLKDKIKQVMDATRKSEDEVCTALHDCDNDPDRAVNLLLEGVGAGEWETLVKKKKRQPNATKVDSPPNNKDGDQEDWEREPGFSSGERSRTRGGGPPRMRGRGSLDNRGWRGRENKENEKNLEEGRDGYRRGSGRMMNGPRSGRGGRGGRLGPRTFQNRDKGGFPRSIETWNNPSVEENSGDGETLKMAPEGQDQPARTRRLPARGTVAPFSSAVPNSCAASSSPDALEHESVGLEHESVGVEHESIGVEHESLGVEHESVEVEHESVGLHVQETEKWDDDFPSPEDWDNEEYTGSLADTKVFTPSAGAAIEPVTNSEPLPEPSTSSAVSELSSSLAAQTLSSSVASSSSQMSSQNLELHQQTNRLSQSPVPVGVSAMSTAPSEYLSQFTQGTESLNSAVGIGTTTPATSYGTTSTNYPVTSSASAAAAYQTPSPPSGFTSTSVPFSTSNYVGTTPNYTEQIQEQSLDTTSSTTQCPPQTMPQRTKSARPRVPPPSKIPATPVEMPGDAVNSIGYLDVQFGGLDFGTETSFETTTEQSKYPNTTPSSVLDSLPSPRASSGLDLSGSNQTSALEAYTVPSTQKSPPQSIGTSLGQGQKLSSADSILPSSEHKASPPNFPQTRTANSTGLDMDKPDVGLPYSAPSTGTYPASYSSQKSSSSSYPTASSYSSSNYSSAQVTSTGTTYQTNQSQMSYTSSGTGSSYSSQTAAPSSYPNSSYSQASAAGVAYQTGPTSYPSITQSTNSFPSANPAYQSTGQSVYGASTLGSTAYAVSAAAAQYQNNYGTSVATTAQNHTKLSSALSTGTKEPQYDTTTTASSNLTSTNATTTNSGLSTVNATPALGLAAASSSQTVNATSTKVTSSSGKGGVMPNIPPGVPPMLGTQYIMSQGGLPYFQQPAMYSYEDIQLLQQRIPHMATGYYDMGFQAPTSLATGRDGGLASVAYSMSDGRYTRADNNASPVPSTLSQQSATQAHQQPMLNPTALPPGYAYFYGGGMMPGGFQYGTPAIYPMPPATNTHGSTTTTQYPKPGSYGSGYGSAYDGLSQNQDYSKTGYVSGSQSQSKAGVGANAGTTGSSASDLSAVYGKSHVALGKVNSYEKQGFHSGTPPPFNLPGSQNTPMAPSGAYAPHLFIPTMAPHQQHHSTTLMHQPLHQMEMRNPGRRSDTGGSSNQRSQSASQPNKSGTKQGYSPSYWTPN